MTCIAGAVINGELCIGGDAVSIHNNSAARLGRDGKVFRVGDFLIGSSGTVRCKQIMNYLFQPPPIDGELTAYMVQSFIPTLRQAMKEHGGECKSQSGDEQMDARLLVGARGRLFEVDCSYSVFESQAIYAAVGCADQEALAAMYTAYSLLQNPLAEDVVNRGLLAAAEFDTSVRPPFTVMTLPQEKSYDLVKTIGNGHRGLPTIKQNCLQTDR
jgi:ATP-dependent protease HslVU (ClpYQ) peptidase subunit